MCKKFVRNVKESVNKEIPNFLSGHVPFLPPNIFQLQIIFRGISFSPSYFSFLWNNSKKSNSMRYLNTPSTYKQNQGILPIALLLKKSNSGHLWCRHYDWISCTAVHLCCSPVYAHLYCKFVLTNESPS